MWSFPVRCDPGAPPAAAGLDSGFRYVPMRPDRPRRCEEVDADLVPGYGGAEYGDMYSDLMWRVGGMKVETPAVRS